MKWICLTFHIWGCPAYVLKGKPDKLEPKSEVCLLVGYPKETRGYFFYIGKITKFLLVQMLILGK